MKSCVSLALRSTVVLLLISSGLASGQAKRISEFGRYEGFSEERFSEWVATSQYLEMRDGVRLAIDVVRPAVEGKAVDEPLPVVWTHSRYHRNPGAIMRMFAGANARLPQIDSMVDTQGALQLLVRHGYVVAAVGVRGSGASFGRYEGLFEKKETRDAYEIVQWLASQPFCNGNVGMFGGSYLGMTQYMAASEMPPALKAIFPDVAGFDLYDLIHAGGIFRDDMLGHWDDLTRRLDTQVLAPPVDADGDGALRDLAIAEHADNWDVGKEYGAGRFRDHRSPELTWLEHGPSAVLDRVRESQVPVYHWNGWYDVFITDTFLWFANLDGPQKVGVGAWAHAGMPDPALNAERGRLSAVEQHRWFDYWLKGIDNGVLDEAPIHYAIMEEPGEWSYRDSETWPPAEAESVRYAFLAGPSGSIGSVNDGRLGVVDAADGAGFEELEADFTATTGSTTRWDNAVGATPAMIYPDLSAQDAKGLTWTTPVLESDLLVIGHPVVTLYASSSTGDADFHVLLEEIDESGASRYVTEGILRASHRRLADAPWNNLDLPFQRSFEEDREPLPTDRPAEVVMDLHPTATRFDQGHRLRVTLQLADADNTETEEVMDPPTVRIHRGGETPSGIVLPVVR